MFIISSSHIFFKKKITLLDIRLEKIESRLNKLQETEETVEDIREDVIVFEKRFEDMGRKVSYLQASCESNGELLDKYGENETEYADVLEELRELRKTVGRQQQQIETMEHTLHRAWRMILLLSNSLMCRCVSARANKNKDKQRTLVLGGSGYRKTETG